MKSISILGATGSIGTQTLDVIRNSEGTINLIGITANSSVDKIKEIIKEFKPKYVICGHIHENGRNIVNIENTKCINVAQSINYIEINSH